MQKVFTSTVRIVSILLGGLAVLSLVPISILTFTGLAMSGSVDFFTTAQILVLFLGPITVTVLAYKITKLIDTNNTSNFNIFLHFAVAIVIPFLIYIFSVTDTFKYYF
jgi:hypothetical protein